MARSLERLFRRWIAAAGLGPPTSEPEKPEDRTAWLGDMMRQAGLRFDSDRARAEAAGVTHYHWRSAGDGGVCRVCRSRDGKRFRLRGDPLFAHPGLLVCDAGIGDGADGGPHPCRCRAEMILPG